MKYYFDLETKDAGGATRHFEAQVWEKPVSRADTPQHCRGANMPLGRAC